jgi:hypothetical protein
MHDNICRHQRLRMEHKVTLVYPVYVISAQITPPHGIEYVMFHSDYVYFIDNSRNDMEHRRVHHAMHQQARHQSRGPRRIGLAPVARAHHQRRFQLCLV